ncbi:hypothetical protein D3C75_855760 [compost metagenome]
MSLVFSLLLSLGLYAGLLKWALAMVMRIDISLAAGTVILPLGCAVLLTAVIFLLPARLLRQTEEFRELRGMV